MTVESITIQKPDDWHVHLRDGEMLQQVAGFTARQLNRAIISPNLSTPITTVQMAADYRIRISQATKQYIEFEPLISALSYKYMESPDFV